MVKVDSTKKTKKPHKFIKPLFVVVIILLILSLSVFVIYHISNVNKKVNKRSATVSKTEQRYSKINNQNLANKDYESYQIVLQEYYQGYFIAKDYKSAENVLKEILTNVPKNSINSSTYYCLSQLYKSENNISQYSKYTKLLISSLQNEGRNEDAAYYKKQLGDSST